MKHKRIHRALENILIAFAPREQPETISFCTICFREYKLLPFLRLPLNEITLEQFDPLIWDGCRCFGTWDEIAYYLPRVLDLCMPEWGMHEDNFYTLFLCANSGATMTEAERKSIIALIEALIEDFLEDDIHANFWRVGEAISFLACFSEPIAPLLNRLETSDNLNTRTGFCLFVARYASGLEEITQSLVTKAPILPENYKVLNALFDAEHAMNLILRDTDIVAIVNPDSLSILDQAFTLLSTPIMERIRKSAQGNSQDGL